MNSISNSHSNNSTGNSASSSSIGSNSGNNMSSSRNSNIFVDMSHGGQQANTNELQLLSSSSPSSTVSSINSYSEKVSSDLLRLSRLAQLRHQYRVKQGALDEYLKQPLWELSLFVRRDSSKYPFKYSVLGFNTWSNASSMSLVSEYMVLMSQTIGCLFRSIHAPVWYKCARIIRHLRMAPGPRFTSGPDAYVQCTSPIRRYHDLYNQYRLKVALHAI